jgi:hypothetical protein
LFRGGGGHERARARVPVVESEVDSTAVWR